MELTIIKDPTLSGGDTKALIKFWKLLVPDYEEFILPCAQTPDSSHIYCIDLPLLRSEGLPKFANVIGERRLQAILRHCGYGVKFSRPLNQKILENDLACLRTLENAQYYLHGFKQLISNMASHLIEAPEDMDTLTRAKYIRNFFVFFSAGEFFVEELWLNKGQLTVNYAKWQQLNKLFFFPEETFLLYTLMGKTVHVRYDAIKFALSQLDNKLCKKVMEFSELCPIEYPVAHASNRKFADYRAIKNQIHADCFHTSYTTFAVKEAFMENKFQSFLVAMLMMTLHPLSEFTPNTRLVKTFEHGQLTTKEVPIYEFTDEILGIFHLSGANERACYFELFDYMANENLTFKGLAYNLETGEPIENHDFEWQTYYALTQFALQRGYISATMPLKKCIENLDVLTEFYSYDDDALRQSIRAMIALYWYSEKSDEDAENLANALGIDRKFEKEYFGIEHKLSPEETILKFAANNGIDIVDSQQTAEMIQGFWIPYFSDAIAKYSEDENETAFKKAIGFDPEFGGAYFNLKDVDVSKLQEKLLNLKRSRASEKQMQSNGLLIALYCYIIEGNIPCGAKNRTPERIKSLRTDNLKSFIAA